MSLDLLLEAALFVERQTQAGEDASAQAEQALPSEEPSNGASTPPPPPPPVACYSPPVIRPATPPALNGKQTTSFYREDSRSPSPVARSFQSAKLTDEQFVQQPQSLYGQLSFQGSNPYRVDDLASRTNRLEEALLRASTKGSTVSGLSPAPSASSSGRTSADELLELKKRSGAGTREVHNKLEKNRRAHLRECFEFLRKQLPASDDKKLSNLGILKNALRHIQTLKRKEREYEHTMERLAREKIASQQRLAALRKEVSAIPGYGSDGAIPLDLNNVLPVVLQSQHHMAHQQRDQHPDSERNDRNERNDRSSPLTIANVQAHNMREENTYRPVGLTGRDADQESNSGTSTASEQGEESDRGATESYLQRHLTAGREKGQSNGRPSPVPLKRPLPDDAETGREEAVKYLRTPVTTPSQPAAYLTMVPSLELSDGSGVYHVRHPSAIFATSAGGHVQLAGPQVLAAHPGVQLLAAHSSSLKVLAAGPNAPVRVFAAADGVPTSLQPIMAVHAPSVVGGSKQEDGMMNGSQGTGAVFCTPSGVVIPGLVALPPSTEAGGSGRSSPSASYEASRSSGFKASSSQAGVTHVMTPITVTRSLPLVANMAVMGQPAKHVAHILANPSIPSLDKMGLIKPGSIPIIGSPYLNAQSGGRHVMKPVVVVAAPQSTSPAGREPAQPPARPASP